jgi:hypothetical protein
MGSFVLSLPANCWQNLHNEENSVGRYLPVATDVP